MSMFMSAWRLKGPFLHLRLSISTCYGILEVPRYYDIPHVRAGVGVYSTAIRLLNPVHCPWNDLPQPASAPVWTLARASPALDRGAYLLYQIILH